jgi:hypothetical protein
MELMESMEMLEREESPVQMSLLGSRSASMLLLALRESTIGR